MTHTAGLPESKLKENAAHFFVERHLDEGRGNKPAFIEVDGAGKTLSYADLSEQSARFAGALERAGFRREERLAMVLLDQNALPVAFWGALKQGTIPVLLNTLLSPALYTYMLNDSRAAGLIVSADLLEGLLPILSDCPSLRKLVVVGKGEYPPGPFEVQSWDRFFDGAKALSPIEVNGDEEAFWLYSSGSTGVPKGVRHVHASLQATCDTYAHGVLGIQETDTIYSAAKLFFAYGLGNGMSFPLSVGATTLLFSSRPTPDAVLSILREYSPTMFGGVPTLYAALLAELEKNPIEAPLALRRCISAGEALPEETGLRWKKMVGVDILDGVGSTEMLHIFLSNHPKDIVYGTSGVAVPGYDMRLVNESGNPAKTGELGELLVRGESAANGYWNQRSKSRATFEGEWTRTGDKYERREDGRYVYAGRTDDLFKVSGIWVSPFEVEQALVTHSAVLEAAVVPRKDDEGLLKPQAFVVLKEGRGSEPLAEELKETVKASVGMWKYPRWVNFVEDLPKTATGKIQRFKLREGLQ